MKNKHIKIILIFLTACLLVACKKELNVFPTTSEVDGNVIIDTKSASTVLNGVYYRFADAGADNNNVPTILWTNINEDFSSELSGGLINGGGDDHIYTFTFNPQTYGIDGIWNYGYNLVNAANGFLKNVAPVTKIPAATKSQMQAEAYFLRAFGNSQILLYYGQYYDPTSKYGIILRDQFVTSANTSLPRSSVAAVYTSILSDLDAAIAGLPSLNSQIYYANSSAAKLLKARVLLNRGAAGDYTQVINLTDDVIKNGPFALEDSVKDVFLTKGFSSKEVILGVQPYPNQNYKFENNQRFDEYSVSDSLVSSLKNDPRSQWMYKNVNTNYNGPQNLITKYFSGDPVNPVANLLGENCYAFRLSEAYLMEAEALALLNGDLTKAKSLLITVETHAGVPDFTAINAATTGAALQLLIVKEELRNFAFENGADWFALRRLGASGSTLNLTQIQKLNPFIPSINSLILPIPQTEITVNNVIQNPGY